MKILWKRGEIAPKEQFLLFSIIFCCLLVDLCVKTGTRFSLRDKRLFEISEFEITRVDCIFIIVEQFYLTFKPLLVKGILFDSSIVVSEYVVTSLSSADKAKLSDSFICMG